MTKVILNFYEVSKYFKFKDIQLLEICRNFNFHKLNHEFH
jgi:hypothetical protein